jgi:hypothetical protein
MDTIKETVIHSGRITVPAARKPNSVPDNGCPLPGNDHSSMDPGCPGPPATYPGTRAGNPQRPLIWSCTGWGLPSFPGHPENWCALTAPFHPYPTKTAVFRNPCQGGILSVALSFTLPRLHVMEHPALRCSDFPPELFLFQRSFGLLRPLFLLLK